LHKIARILHKNARSVNRVEATNLIIDSTATVRVLVQRERSQHLYVGGILDQPGSPATTVYSWNIASIRSP
jgi:hypothetical protein